MLLFIAGVSPGVYLFFQLICRCYQRVRMMITSQPIDFWYPAYPKRQIENSLIAGLPLRLKNLHKMLR